MQILFSSVIILIQTSAAATSKPGSRLNESFSNEVINGTQLFVVDVVSNKSAQILFRS